MLKMVVNNDRDEDEVDQPVLKTASKGPTDGDWLSPMRSGTEFLVRGRSAAGHPRWLLSEFTHGGKKAGNVLLCPTQTLNDIRTWIWVDPVEFCKVFELRGVLEEPDE